MLPNFPIRYKFLTGQSIVVNLLFFSPAWGLYPSGVTSGGYFPPFISYFCSWHSFRMGRIVYPQYGQGAVHDLVSKPKYFCRLFCRIWLNEICKVAWVGGRDRQIKSPTLYCR